jgi:hypothetical protein
MVRPLPGARALLALLTDGSASYGPTPRSSSVCAEGVLNASHLFRLLARKLFTQKS